MSVRNFPLWSKLATKCSEVFRSVSNTTGVPSKSTKTAAKSLKVFETFQPIPKRFRGVFNQIARTFATPNRRCRTRAYHFVRRSQGDIQNVSKSCYSNIPDLTSGKNWDSEVRIQPIVSKTSRGPLPEFQHIPPQLASARRWYSQWCWSISPALVSSSDLLAKNLAPQCGSRQPFLTQLLSRPNNWTGQMTLAT